mgnify:CR=1 FL=1
MDERLTDKELEAIRRVEMATRADPRDGSSVPALLLAHIEALDALLEQAAYTLELAEHGLAMTESHPYTLGRVQTALQAIREWREGR